MIHLCICLERAVTNLRLHLFLSMEYLLMLAPPLAPVPKHTSTSNSGYTESRTGSHTLSYFVSYLCCLARHLTLLRLLVQPMWRARVSLTTLQPREVRQALGRAHADRRGNPSLKSTTCVRRSSTFQEEHLKRPRPDCPSCATVHLPPGSSRVFHLACVSLFMRKTYESFGFSANGILCHYSRESVYVRVHRYRPFLTDDREIREMAISATLTERSEVRACQNSSFGRQTSHDDGFRTNGDLTMTFVKRLEGLDLCVLVLALGSGGICRP